MISIHAPTRGATDRGTSGFRNYEISIHAPTRGATVIIWNRGLSYFISIHAPTRGATEVVIDGFLQLRHFNPRSHEGSDGQNAKYSRPDFAISIHAPTRGATADVVFCESGTYISIHAPTRGATFLIRKTPHQRRDFNPRSHEGSDGY